MKSRILASIVLAAVALALAGCDNTCDSTGGGFPPQTAKETQKIPGDKRIEISLAPGTFAIEEVEFHVPSSALPQKILDKAKELFPEGTIGDCEVEYHGGKVYYEVTAAVGGSEQEVMFTEQGEPYRWELEVAESDVPGNVLEAARTAVEGAKIDKSESILGPQKDLLEYHLKLSKDNVKYKVVVSTAGELQRIYRETIGEIEVPIK